MKNEPILTIGIPAYNRTSNLENLIKQLQNEDTSLFKILICDDASPDNPSEMVEKYLEKMPNLKYIRNESNLGFSANVCQIYDKAETPYIWFICDDDEIIPGCIPSIVDALNKYDPTVTILNHKWINPYGIRRTAGVSEDILYENESDITDYSVLMRTTFLSTLILKRIKDTSEIKETDYKNNVFIQITMVLMLLKGKFRLLELSIPAIERYVGFKYGEFFKFSIVDHIRAIFALDHSLSNKKFLDWAKGEIPTAFQLYLSQKLGMFSYKGIPTLRTIKEIIKYYGIHSLLIFSFIPLYFIIPNFILKFIYKIHLYYFHDPKTAKLIYNQNINRTYKDERKTGFTEYR